MFSALSLAKKARREFEKAVELDEKTFPAQQALIEFDCKRSGHSGGGEDKSAPGNRQARGARYREAITPREIAAVKKRLHGPDANSPSSELHPKFFRASLRHR